MPRFPDWTNRQRRNPMLAPDQTRQSAVFDHLRHSILTGALPGGGRLPPAVRWHRNSGSPGRPSCWPTSGWRPRAMSGGAPAAAPMSQRICRIRPHPRRATPPVAAVALSARGASLAEIPATASARDPALGLLLAGGLPAPDLFPIKAWARCTSRVMKPLVGELSSYPPPQGLLVLREQIAAHLAATRGLVADPGCIVVTSGTQQALRTAADLLMDPGDAAWVEDPGYIAGRGALCAAGAEIVPIPSDAEGIDVGAGVGIAAHARLALVAPSHATPSGRRAADRPPPRSAGLGPARQRLGIGGRLRLGVPLGGQAAAAAGNTG